MFMEIGITWLAGGEFPWMGIMRESGKVSKYKVTDAENAIWK